jgi:polyisoprenoid-binding protein YceI
MTSSAPAGSTPLARLADGSLAGHWVLDPAQSTVGLQSKSIWGLVSVKGTFTEVAGEANVTPAGEVSGTITVNAASIDTKMKKRDDHLRSADFFLTETYPHITFTASQVSLDAGQAVISGTLQVRDQTRSLTFPVTVTESSPDAVVVDAQVHIDRSDFGLTWSQLRMASMKNVLTIHAVLKRSS